MAAHGGGDEAKAHVTLRVGKGNRPPQPYMAKCFWPHAMGRSRVRRLLHHAAQAIAHGPQQRAVHIVTVLAGEFCNQLGCHQAPAQQRAVKTGQPMGGAVAIYPWLAIGPPARDGG